MYGLTNEEKLKFIINTSKELGITSYEFAQNCKISDLGARNILNGSSKNPRSRNLNIMLEYLMQKKASSRFKTSQQPLSEVREHESYYETENSTAFEVLKIIEPRLSEIEHRLETLENLKK